MRPSSGCRRTGECRPAAGPAAPLGAEPIRVRAGVSPAGALPVPLPVRVRVRLRLRAAVRGHTGAACRPRYLRARRRRRVTQGQGIPPAAGCGPSAPSPSLARPRAPLGWPGGAESHTDPALPSASRQPPALLSPSRSPPDRTSCLAFPLRAPFPPRCAPLAPHKTSFPAMRLLTFSASACGREAAPGRAAPQRDPPCPGRWGAAAAEDPAGRCRAPRTCRRTHAGTWPYPSERRTVPAACSLPRAAPGVSLVPVLGSRTAAWRKPLQLPLAPRTGLSRLPSRPRSSLLLCSSIPSRVLSQFRSSAGPMCSHLAHAYLCFAAAPSPALLSAAQPCPSCCFPAYLRISHS